MKKSTRIGWYFLLVILVYFLLGFLVAFIPDNVKTVNFSFLFGQISIFIPILIYIIATRGNALKDIPFKKIKIENAIIVIIFSWVCMPIAGFLNVVSMLFADNHVAGTVGPLMDNMFIVNLLMIAILPAIIEEIAYRGIVYYGLREYGVIAAVVVSGVLFGLNHMNVNQFIYACMLGMVFALMDEASGSILASMIMHFMFNVNTVLLIEMYKLMPYIEKISGEKTVQESAQAVENLAAYPVKTRIILVAGYGVFAIAAVFINTKIFIWYSKRCGRWEHIKECFHNAGKGFKKTENGRIISIPALAGAAVCIAFMILEFV